MMHADKMKVTVPITIAWPVYFRMIWWLNLNLLISIIVYLLHYYYRNLVVVYL